MQPERAAKSFAVAMTVLLLAAASAAAQQAPKPPDRAVLERLDRVIAERMDASGVPGFSLAVVAGDRIVHARGFGEADASGRAVGADTPFVTGSSGKAFTALALIQLVEAGKLDLDAPVRRYVPELRTADQSEADRITVRHVAQHTSGFRTEAGGAVLHSAADGGSLEVVAEVRDEKLVSSPGQSFHYSNINYVLAGLVIERASGEPFADYMRRHVFAPLGMHRTFTALAEARAAGLASGARYWFGLTRWHGPTFRPGLQAAGYYVSTATDMARFLRLFLADGVIDGRRIVSERGLETLLMPGRQAHLGPWADGAGARYAMGWFKGGPWREPVFFHPGNTPDSSSMLVVMPERGWAAASMTNISNELPIPGNPSVPDRLGRNVVDVLLGEPVGGASARSFYAKFDLVVAAIFGLLLWSLTRAALAVRRAAAVRHFRHSALGVVARALAGTLIALSPGLTLGWASSWLWSPDLTLTVVVLGSTLVLIAAVRAAWLVRAERRADPPVGDSPRNPPSKPSASWSSSDQPRRLRVSLVAAVDELPARQASPSVSKRPPTRHSRPMPGD